MAVGAVVARILTQYSDKGSKAAQKDIVKLGKKIDSFGKKATKAFLAVGTATAVMAVKIGTDAVKAAIEDSKSQAILANNLRNVTGATDATIKSVEEYITKQQMLANVSDTELRASFSQLVLATGDVTTAMDLQSVALDTAAGSGKDLGSVSAAIAKATQGNFTALKKLVPTLDANIVKNKDLGAALVFLDKTFKGSAKTLGDTDPLKKLSLAYGEVLETLGFALLPVVIEFAEYIRTDVLPQVEEWVALNEGRLQDSFRTTLNTVVALTKSLLNLLQVLEDWKYLLLALASIPYFAALSTNLLVIAAAGRAINKALIGPVLGFLKFGATYVGKFITAIRLLATAFTTLGIRAAIAAIPVALATAGVSVVAATTALAVVGVTAFVISKNMKDATNSTEGATAAAVDLTKQVYGGAAAEKYKAEVAAKAAKDKLERDKRLAVITARQAANDKKTAAAAALLDKQQSALTKFGVKTDETDPKQLNAAIALVERQKDINILDKARLERMKEEILLLKVRNDLAMRYDDILKVLADNKITTEEVQILSLKWGVAKEAVNAYLLQLKIIEDGTISDDEIIKLAKSWGSTYDQAAQYLDFFEALNDGILSNAEIEKLKSKWKLTEDQVRMYADFVGIVNDGKLTDAEIIKIKDKWKLTTDQVVDYIKQIGSPVSYNGSMLTTAQAAELAWKNATAALEEFLRKQAAAAAGGFGPGKSVIPPVVIPPIVIPPVVIPPVVIVPGYGSSKDEKEEAAAAEAYAKAKAAGDMAAAAIAAAGVTPSVIAAQENGIIGAASIAAKLREAEEELAAAVAAANQASTLSAFRDKEQRDLATSQSAAAAMDYDERFRHMAAQGVLSASASSSSQAPVVVNLTVNGSVTSENDLVQTLRAGLLRGQYNGQSITLEAI